MALGPVSQPLLAATLVVALAVTAALLAVATRAYRDRRSLPYLLVLGAVAAIALQPVIGALAPMAAFPADAHHLAEHGLDGLAALLVIAAAYTFRAERRRTHVEGSDDR